MATTRLRRTFRYPTDDSDEPIEGLDEQDQDALIASLSTHDTTTTSLYTHILLSLPIFPALFYLSRLTSPSTLPGSFFSIASLLATAYTLYFLPLPPVRIGITTTTGSTTSKGKSIARDTHGRPTETPASTDNDTRPLPYLTPEQSALVRRYLIPANALLCAIFALYELSQGRAWSEGMMIGGGYVPGFIFAVILVARRELRTFDLGELEGLRYRFKGA
ncbi:hypothetical protein BCR34DRAFT_492009 [Clohesyomyces aquaticus]|uniref:Uncharacterized protein n=1 Tax=Clohesyomyces aquaticus TaxID=1231657 RepID=A0A1Y1Z0W9_9PLEO|nr:hypothetical protein BCR34DRAFT_492009 [Clohesyomyces aquaticus]